MPERLFDASAFGRRVRTAIDARHLSLRKVARAIGVDHSALYRLTCGQEPRVETFLRVERWLKRSGQ